MSFPLPFVMVNVLALILLLLVYLMTNYYLLYVHLLNLLTLSRYLRQFMMFCLILGDVVRMIEKVNALDDSST